MKKLLFTGLRLLLKLFAIALSPVIRILLWAYHIVAYVISYGCLGLSVICLFATTMELINVGLSQEAVAYIVTAAISFVLRWLVMYLIPILHAVQEAVDIRASMPINDGKSYYYDADSYYSFD